MDAADAAHGLDHVDRHADGAALIGDGAGDRLADPPGGVGGELVAAGVLELVHRPHQARVALLDQVEEAQAAVAVALGDGDDQPQVAGGEAALGGFVVAGERLAMRAMRRRSVAGLSSVIRIRWHSSLRRSARRAALRRRGPIRRSAPGGRPSAGKSASASPGPAASRCVRRPSSSTSRTARLRRLASRCQACAALLAAAVLVDGR